MGNIDLRHGDCLEIMKSFENDYIDLTVTSPPYDNLRTYNNSLEWGEHIWKPVIKELYRITKDGGVVVWVVGDATIKGSETGTSFKQALYFMECGFNLHDTMIWHKPNAMPQVDKSRNCQCFEYMFIFSKGKPNSTNIIKILTKNAGKTIKRKTLQNENMNKKERTDTTKKTRLAFNVYSLNVGGKKEAEHPALFPEQLAKDHITTWSNENDIVFDPFMGSGTTGKMALLKNRKFIGIEKDLNYFNIAKKRIKKTVYQPELFKEEKWL